MEVRLLRLWCCAIISRSLGRSGSGNSHASPALSLYYLPPPRPRSQLQSLAGTVKTRASGAFVVGRRKWLLTKNKATKDSFLNILIVTQEPPLDCFPLQTFLFPFCLDTIFHFIKVDYGSSVLSSARQRLRKSQGTC